MREIICESWCNIKPNTGNLVMWAESGVWRVKNLILYRPVLIEGVYVTMEFGFIVKWFGLEGTPIPWRW